MIDIAAHIRIFDPTPSDDLVKKRTTAIKLLSSNLKKTRSVETIFQWVNDLARALEVDGELSETLVNKIEAAVRKSSIAFIAENEELQIIVCGSLAALYLLDSTLPKSNSVNRNAMAIGLWSALSYQAPRCEAKLEALRVELLQKAQQTVLHTANLSRRRIEVPNISFEEAFEETEAPHICEVLETGMKNTITALRANALLDREELNLLWWVLSDWSDLLGRRFSSLNNPEIKAVVSGLEAGSLLRGLPADAHNNLVLRHVGETDTMSLPELLKAFGSDREGLAKAHGENAVVASFPVIFPLLTALQSGSATGAGVEIKRPLEEWASRALLESATVNITTPFSSVAV